MYSEFKESPKGREPNFFFFHIYYFGVLIVRSYTSPDMVPMLGFPYCTFAVLN